MFSLVIPLQSGANKVNKLTFITFGYGWFGDLLLLLGWGLGELRYNGRGYGYCHAPRFAWSRRSRRSSLRAFAVRASGGSPVRTLFVAASAATPALVTRAFTVAVRIWKRKSSREKCNGRFLPTAQRLGHRLVSVKNKIFALFWIPILLASFTCKFYL